MSRHPKALHFNCGTPAQSKLLYGVRRSVRRLHDPGIAHRYEEFPDDHSTIDPPMDERLPFPAEGLSP